MSTSSARNDPVTSFLQTCLRTVSASLDPEQLLRRIPQLWTFTRDCLYRQIRRYTQLQGGRASCHVDISSDQSHEFWLGASGFLLETTQNYLQQLWATSHEFSELLDLACVATSPAYPVSPVCFRAALTSLDMLSGLIQQFLTYIGSQLTDSLVYLPELTAEDAAPLPLTVNGSCSTNGTRKREPQFAEFRAVNDPFLSSESFDKSEAYVVSLLEQLRGTLTDTREFVGTLPELRILRRDARISFISLESRRRLQRCVEPLKRFLSLDELTQNNSNKHEQECIIPEGIQQNFAASILGIVSVPVALRRALIRALANLSQALSAQIGRAHV